MLYLSEGVKVLQNHNKLLQEHNEELRRDNLNLMNESLKYAKQIQDLQNENKKLRAYVPNFDVLKGTLKIIEDWEEEIKKL